MIQIKESDLDIYIGLMDEVCTSWEFEMIKQHIIRLLGGVC